MTKERIQATGVRRGIQIAERLLSDPRTRPNQLTKALDFISKHVAEPEKEPTDVQRILAGEVNV